MRWIAMLCVVAACGGEESKKQEPPAQVARNTAPIPELDAAPPDAEARVALMTDENRKTLDRIQNLDELPDLSKYSGPPEQGGSGTGTGVVGPRLKFEASSGDYTGLTKEEVDRVVKSRAGTFKACYQKELNRVKDLAGKLTIEFMIDADGTVSRAKVVESSTTLDNTAVQDCVKRQIMRLKFPAKGGALVKYPFLFSNA